MPKQIFISKIVCDTDKIAEYTKEIRAMQKYYADLGFKNGFPPFGWHEPDELEKMKEQYLK